MKIWLSAGFVPAARLAEFAQASEEAGIEGLAFADHVCTPRTIETPYPYTEDGQATIPLGAEFPDSIAASAALGAVTTRLRFTPHVLIAPARHPILLAKEIGTVETLIGGRLELSVGVGWMREDYAAVGVPFERRGSRLDEMLEILSNLWTGELYEFHGEHFSFDPLVVKPVPPTPPRIIVGGQSTAAFHRAARYDGWTGITPTVDEFARMLEELHAARQAAGSDDRPFEIRTGTKGRLRPDRIGALSNLGVTSLFVGLWQVLPSMTSIYDVPLDDVIAALPVLVDLVESSSS
jgi:probable F420-dependent oxidoreductase